MGSKTIYEANTNRVLIKKYLNLNLFFANPHNKRLFLKK
ncbi:hypothetical protein HFN_1590 [Helicobacter fennelliae MRY12-0050]|uniref:Uncharacterized protein n=1 Tax=Helicobacter fennelliae MRY12-0050 TaxID=1325130 RepID=T1DXF0_9HELI|nr:hypothetical protein HFN_1590 [Helicobacter fennelliae MRY12-0050]